MPEIYFSKNFIILHIVYLYAHWNKSVKIMRYTFDEYVLAYIQ